MSQNTLKPASADTSNQDGSTHITPADGNVFFDLGFSPDESNKLLAEFMAEHKAGQFATRSAV